MRIYLSGTDREYDLQCLSLLFFPGSDFSSDDGKELSVTVEGNTATAVFKLGENEYKATAEVRDEFDSARLAVKHNKPVGAADRYQVRALLRNSQRGARR